MALKVRERTTMNHLLLLDVLIDDDDDFGFNIELGTLAKNIKKKVIRVFFFP
jgi:hypothetical protein